MSIRIKIQPVAYPETSKAERAHRASALADEMRQIEGVENARVWEPIQKLGGIQNGLDPTIVAALIQGGAAVVTATVASILAVLATKRSKGEQRETIITINNNWYKITDGSERAAVEAEILDEIKSLILDQKNPQKEKEPAMSKEEEEKEARIKIAEGAIEETAKARKAWVRAAATHSLNEPKAKEDMRKAEQAETEVLRLLGIQPEDIAHLRPWKTEPPKE